MSARTFGQAGKDFLTFRAAKKSPKTARKHAWLLTKLRPLHGRDLTKIEAPDVMAVLEDMERGGRAETARRVGQFCAAVFRHAVRKGWCRHNPATELRGGLEGVTVKSHPGITNPEKFGSMMLLIDMPGYSYPTVYNALRLLARTALRPGELRQGLWSEIDWEKAEWRIPAARMKMRRELMVPLSTQAIEILEAQRAHILPDDLSEPTYIFPGLRSGRPISDAAMNVALKNLFIPPSDHVPHGFRSSFSSMLNELGEDSAVIELQLSHAKKDQIAGIYDRSQRIPDRRKLMQFWSDYIETCKRKAL